MDRNDYIKAIIKSPYDTELLKELFKENVAQIKKTNTRTRTLKKKNMDYGFDR